MFESIGNFFKRITKPENKELGSKDSAKERLHLVLMQDRANVSADFLELMKQEIIDVIKKYIVVDETSIDVRLTNQSNDDGTNGAPALYANIPIINIKNDMKAEKIKEFDGVNFNKKLEEVKEEEKEIIKKEEIMSEMINGEVDSKEENKKETEKQEDVVTAEEKQEDNKNNKDKKNKSKKQSKNNQENSEKLEEKEYEEDDDDDVTFDDLLKAAEEEDKKKVNEES